MSRDAFAKLQMWQRMMSTAPAMIDGMSRELAQETLVLIEEGFQRQTDPYGRPWTPKKRPDGRPILVGRTLRLRSRWRIVRSQRSGWAVQPGVDYAAAHQEPRRFGRQGRYRVRPQRMMVPSRSRGLPRAWTERYIAVAGKSALKHFRNR